MSFIRYTPEDSIISSETVVRGLWDNDNMEMNNFISSSNTEYYSNIYSSSSPSASVQFSIQYGHISGSNSTPINGDITGSTPSRVIYGQYRNLIYSNENSNFQFDGVSSDDIFILNINRSRYKESLKPGSFNLKLTNGANSLYLTDNSKDIKVNEYIDSNRVFNIVSGSNGSESNSSISNPSGGYGLFLPDIGIIILNTSALVSSVANGGLNISRSSLYNTNTLFNLIKNGGSFKLQSQETVSSRYFFTYVKPNECNYTSNPSIIDDNGNLIYLNLIDNPQSYITTIGLYNDNNDLLAVAKLSQPLTKDFTKVANIRVKLDY